MRKKAPEQTRHTPGPWHTMNVFTVATTEAAVIAEVRNTPDRFDYQAAANARLIAAAPDLLMALRRSLDWLASYPGGAATGIYEAARTVVAQAEGR